MMNIVNLISQCIRRDILVIVCALAAISLSSGSSWAEDSPASRVSDEPASTLQLPVPGLAGLEGWSTGTGEQSVAQIEQGGSTPVVAASKASVNPNHRYTLNIRLTPWLAQPNGDAALGSLGTDVDLHDDLGLNNYKVRPAGSANLRFGNHDFWFDALVFNENESSVLTRTITFGSLTIPVSRAIRSEVDIQLYDLGYGYSFFDQETDGFRFGPTIGVAYLDFDVRITDLVAASTETLSETLPLPRLGLQGSIPIGDFEIGAKVAGLYLKFRDFKGYSVEGDISIAWRPVRHFGIVAGYRAITTDIDHNNDNINLTFQGPYVGAELRF
jgi:hypothetical protein